VARPAWPLRRAPTLRTGAWRRNPEPGSSRYSSAEDEVDDKDGAGAPTADALSAFCGTLVSPGDPIGPETQFVQDEALDTFNAPPAPSFVADPSTHIGGELTSLGPYSLYPGDRFRATLSWDSCQFGKEGTDPLKPLDFDLALCRKDSGTCVAFSSSMDDANEGFDVDITEPGWYSLFWSAPVGTTTCYPPQVSQIHILERVSVAVAWGSALMFEAPIACLLESQP
jgi:hypothetical protein